MTQVTGQQWEAVPPTFHMSWHGVVCLAGDAPVATQRCDHAHGTVQAARDCSVTWAAALNIAGSN